MTEEIKKTRKPRNKAIKEEDTPNNIDNNILETNKLETSKSKTNKTRGKAKQSSITPLEAPILETSNTTSSSKTTSNNTTKTTPPNLIIPKQIPYNASISHIYHISDIHIQLYKRHNEYREVFQRLYHYLAEEKTNAGIPATLNRDIPFIVVITGDILHSKADLSPECIQLTYEFIKSLSSIMPVVMIAGNHDININNRDRLDSLTPILADLPTAQPVYYLLETGIYQFANVIFHHSSIMDSKITLHRPEEVSIIGNYKNIRHIALYHGRVNGAVYFNGMACNDPTQSIGEIGNTNISGNKTITPAAFEHYDLALLGDIHKMQFLTPTVAYAGSLIQQNIGETIHEHGVIKWSLASRTGQHIPIYNEWTYVSFYVDNKKASYLCTAPDGTHHTDCTLSKNISVRVLYRNTPESYLMDYITLLKMNHNVVDYRWNNDEPLALFPTTTESTQSTASIQSGSNEFIENNTITANNRNRPCLVDITSPEVQMGYLEELILQAHPQITQQDINSIKIMNTEYNKQLRESHKQFNNYAFNGHYKIKRLEFSNLFSFGEGNVIDFTDFKGIVGIIAPNHLGKSSILDIIVYTLFDDFTRKGSTKDIININKDEFRVRLDIAIAQWTYTIIKTGQRTKAGASVKVDFYRKQDGTGIIERLEEDNASKTKDRIMEYFGCYEDIIHTSFSIQHDNACFIDSTNIKRKDELERIMRFEIVKKLYELVNQRFNKDKAVYEHIRKKINSDDITRLKKSRTKLLRHLDITVADKEYAKSCMVRLRERILAETGKLHKFEELDDTVTEEETEELLGCLEEELLDTSSKITELQSSISQSPNSLVSDKQELMKLETELTRTVNETTKKIKQADITLEKLYKTRKPINTKITGAKPPEEYITNLSSQVTDEIEQLECQQDEIMEQINKLREQQNQRAQNEITMPPELIHLIESLVPSNITSNIIENIETEYIDNLECLLDTIQTATQEKTPFTIASLLASAEYKEWNCIARRYFVTKELQPILASLSRNIKTQNSKESRNETSNPSRELEMLESSHKKLTNQIVKGRAQLHILENDLVNLETNSGIETDINERKQQRQQWELKIAESNIQIEDIRKRLAKIAELESLELKTRKLALDIKEARDTLELLVQNREKIEENKITNAAIQLLKNELAEYEEVLGLIESREHQERTAMNKATGLLEQMKRDIAEARTMEATLRLQEIYRNALRELPYILLGKIQPLLEKKVNDLLSITTDFTVRFDMADSKIDIYLDRPIYNTVSARAHLDKQDKQDKSRCILINNASGFERFMASLAIRLALLDLSNLPKINFLAIDEGWSSFDTHNINNVSMILDYLTSKFDFVLTISHLIQIKEHCDIQISLRRDDKGFSKIIL